MERDGAAVDGGGAMTATSEQIWNILEVTCNFRNERYGLTLRPVGDFHYPSIECNGHRVAIGNQVGLSVENIVDNLERVFREAELYGALHGLTSLEPAFLE